MSNQKPPKFKKGSKASLYLELAKPDELGFSRPVSVEEFEGNMSPQIRKWW